MTPVRAGVLDTRLPRLPAGASADRAAEGGSPSHGADAAPSSSMVNPSFADLSSTQPRGPAEYTQPWGPATVLAGVVAAWTARALDDHPSRHRNSLLDQAAGPQAWLRTETRDCGGGTPRGRDARVNAGDRGRPARPDPAARGAASSPGGTRTHAVAVRRGGSRSRCPGGPRCAMGSVPGIFGRSISPGFNKPG
jgi:hypothetical protein